MTSQTIYIIDADGNTRRVVQDMAQCMQVESQAFSTAE